MTTVAVTGASGHSAATSRATCTNTHTQWWRWTGVPDPGLPTRRSTSYMADRLAGRPGAPAEQVVHGWDHAFLLHTRPGRRRCCRAGRSSAA